MNTMKNLQIVDSFLFALRGKKDELMVTKEGGRFVVRSKDRERVGLSIEFAKLAFPLGLSPERECWWGYHAPLVLVGELPEELPDLRRVAIEVGLRLDFDDSRYWLSGIFEGVDLRGVDLSKADIGGGGEEKDLLSCDLRGARPLDKVVVCAWGFNLARCTFDPEQVEVLVTAAAEKGRYTEILRNPLCSADQVDRVLAGIEKEGLGHLLGDVMRAPNLSPATAERLALGVAVGDDLDRALADRELNPHLRGLLARRRMALAPAKWQGLAPASVPVTVTEKVDVPSGTPLATFRLDLNEFPPDAMTDLPLWWGDTDGQRVLEVYKSAEGEFSAYVLVEHGEYDWDGDYRATLVVHAVLVDAAAVFGGGRLD
ncbi:hypothetical protein HYV73_03820 [Candidatus Uhrbacteria bacterium]|nr:hypothetical protein [Candidatus Uhrbacteria bacterium]